MATSPDPMDTVYRTLMGNYAPSTTAPRLRDAFTSSWDKALILRCRFNMRDCTCVPLRHQGSPPMTIQEAVNNAVEGGYHLHGTDGIATVYTGANNEYSAWTRTDNRKLLLSDPGRGNFP